MASSALLAACKDGPQTAAKQQEPEKGKMTYRVNPGTKDRVSLLGYGMMRLPDKNAGKDPSTGTGEIEIDQEMVNRQVDYAIEHGVNYFDTSPAYCQGKSERATGIALSRHKRSEYFIATKMSNFSPDTWKREAPIEMFENSLKELQVDYIDYLLLHAIGQGSDALGMFNSRYMDNGILDWLVEQKRKGRIRNLGFSYHGDVKIYDMLLKWHDEGRYHWDFVQIELNYLDWNYANEINDRNTDAVYLYGELKKRGIPAVIMEPLLGGRLANVPDNIVAKMKQREPEQSVASCIPLRRNARRGAYRAVGHDLHGASSREPLHLFAPQAVDGRRAEVPHGNSRRHLQPEDYTLQRLQILYALPLRHRHSGRAPAL